MIVFRLGPRSPAAGVIVFRQGRHTTRRTHGDPYVRSCLLSLVTMRTVCRCAAAVGHLADEKSFAYAIDPNPDLSATPSTLIGAVDGVADMPPGLSATPSTPIGA